ncbi:MAG: hypothetical protein FJY09_04215 [Chlorobi bacterium]|nr:hypothetical protein [Chlorobiota bacterium]
MKNSAAIWIDHREALVVSLAGETVTLRHLQSGAESHFKPSGGWKSGGTIVAQSVVNEKSAEESRMHQYHAFYRNIIPLLENADAIAIFGPGEAKTEFAGEIGKVHVLRDKISAVEACDRMTENQFLAKAKGYFAS